MDWHTLRNKRTSLSGPAGFPLQLPPYLRFAAQPLDKPELAPPKTSCYTLQHPLFCADWGAHGGAEMVALSLFREGFHNRIQVAHGTRYRTHDDDYDYSELPPALARSSLLLDGLRTPKEPLPPAQQAFEFARLADGVVDYPVTHLQWDPAMGSSHAPRLAALLEALRLYVLDDAEGQLVQTHLLANNLTTNTLSDGREPYDISTFPPVTLFDWNTADPSIIITLSVDTTCTVWDLHRSHGLGPDKDTAHVKTQLIAHDLEVFDVKFLHALTNVFASVSNDGSMRLFDLRLLEHSTIIYEPALPPPPAAHTANYNPQALLKLATSNVDQHHLATVGVNLNQVLVIDMRMPGLPLVTIDALFGGASPCAVNSLAWHPSSNLLLTGGDDCQALVWDCSGAADGSVIDTPVLAYLDDLEVNTVCWRSLGDWMGVVSGKTFQAVYAR